MDCRFTLVFALAAACGCARVSLALSGNLGGSSDSGAPASEGTSLDLAAPWIARDLATPAPARDLAAPARDLAAPARDLATTPDLATARDLAPLPDLDVVAGCHLVINEIQTGTSQTLTEEFVEIYNPCPAAVTVDNFKLVYRAASNTNPRSGADNGTLFTFAGSIAAGAYRVLGGSGFTGSKNGALASGIAASGALGIRDAAGQLVDSVSWGAVAGNTFAETAAAPLPPTLPSPGGSIERLPDGADSDDNSRDFQIAASVTPGAAND